jgi:hypothetical protein
MAGSRLLRRKQRDWTTNHYLESVLGRCRLRRFRGVYSCDNIPRHIAEQKYFSIICNWDREGRPGSHFVAIIGRPDRVLYIDPLGLDCYNEDINAFLDTAANCKLWKRPIDVQAVPMQDIMSMMCGYHCMLAVLYFDRDNHGIIIDESRSRGGLLMDEAQCKKYIVKLINIYKTE